MKKNISYLDSVHLNGRIWGFIICFLLFAFPVAVSFIFDCLPNWSALFQGLIATAPMYWAVGFIEMFTYVPMLGAGGTYLSFVTGNISNLKLPCGLKAMQQAKVRANTEEGEVITTIAIAVSSIVTTVIIAVGVLAFGPYLGLLTEGTLAPAFDYVLPALFGALAAGYILKHWKVMIAPLVAGVLFLYFVDPTMGAGTLMFITIVVAVISVLVLNKMNKL